MHTTEKQADVSATNIRDGVENEGVLRGHNLYTKVSPTATYIVLVLLPVPSAELRRFPLQQ